MRLSDLFSGGQVNHTGTQAQQLQSTAPNVNTAAVNRQIQSLVPGQTIQGEVVARSGGEVQIKVAEDMVLNARIDPGMQLDLGKILTFEVRNNGQFLALSPLFSNTSTDANVLKALDMASMPVNQTTVTMTGLMMEAGLPIDRSSLQQMFREVNAFQEANLSDIVDLHKLGLPVNEENLTQIASYKNLTHQLVDGMHTVLDALPESIQEMVREGNTEGAARVFQQLLQLVREMPEAAETAEGAVAAEGAEPTGENVQTMSLPAGTAQEAETLAQAKIVFSEALEGMAEEGVDISPATAERAASPNGAEKVSAAVLAEGEDGVLAETADADNAVFHSPLSRELLQLVRGAGADEGRYSALLQQLDTAAQSGNIGEQADVLQQIIQQGFAEKQEPLLRELISNRSVQKLLTDGLSKLWTIEPEEVADRGKVEELYQRLDRQLKSLNHVLEQSGQTESRAFRAVNNMTQNLDFLHQLNQAYTYVQLPLRLQQGEAHGDLYVYTNKRNLAAKDGQISALLHLDMEHLGPVDVYVAMQAEKVNTRFYVQDDGMLDFLEQHMDLLTKRLAKRGYDCNFAMQVRDKGEEPESGLNGLTAQDKGHTIVQYAFDMRA